MCGASVIKICLFLLLARYPFLAAFPNKAEHVSAGEGVTGLNQLQTQTFTTGLNQWGCFYGVLCEKWWSILSSLRFSVLPAHCSASECVPFCSDTSTLSALMLKCFEIESLDFLSFVSIPEPLLSSLLRRMPDLEALQIMQLVNCPESFTPDMRCIMGESPTVRGYFVLAGMNSAGISYGGGAGK